MIVDLESIKRGRLSAEERDQIAALAGRGFSVGRIAQKLNRHPSTVNFALHTMGLRTTKPQSRHSYVRKGSLVCAFSPDEDAYITELRDKGLSTTLIADLASRKFNHRRSAATVLTRLKMLANVEEGR